MRWLYLAVLGAIGAVVTLGERLEALARSKIWMYVYILVDLFKIEIAAAMLLLLVWDLVAASSRPRQGRTLATIVVVGLAALTLYEGRYYVAGKRIYLHEYPRRLVLRAEHAFAQNDRWLAGVHLSACHEVFRSELCAVAQRDLQARVERAQRLREYLRNLPPGTPPPIDILETAYLLDRDRLLYEQEAQKIEATFTRLTQRYTEGIGLIAAGEFRAARSALEGIQHSWHGFGDCHIIVRELATLPAGGDIDDQRTPYVAAVRRYGVDGFVRRTLKIDRPRNSASIVKEGPRPLMFVGGYFE